eukprot:393698-Rhodomonas_salina.4
MPRTKGGVLRLHTARQPTSPAPLSLPVRGFTAVSTGQGGAKAHTTEGATFLRTALPPIGLRVAASFSPSCSQQSDLYQCRESL